jgi:hypothetical protein
VSGWPGNPVASMDVDSFHGGTESSITVASTPAQQTVTDAHIDFRIDVEFHDHPWFDNGRGYFSAQLEKLTVNGWALADFQSLTLGDDDHDGDWYDALTVSTTMTEPAEQYRITLHCETRDTSLGTSADATAFLQAVQGQSAIGDFTLDFVPMSIVYCPPGQDMTASLTQSESYGTRFTIGESSGMESQTGVQFKVDFLGLFGEGVGFSQSQSTTNQSTSGIQVSHFRSTVVTADNQKAIGRAYWGPLGDIFVILVNPSFAASRRADGTILYSLQQIEQVLLIPAYKLLRPDGDPIAGAVPSDVRQRLLQLDPFLHNLDRFFPDSGDDLAVAANPFADPSANNRTEMIGRWWLDAGTELNYALGDSQQLFSSSATEVKFSSTVSINASAGADFDGISAALGVSQSNTTSVGFQTSKETDASFATTASCFLIHNQNERDLDGIEIYYDKIFSTFMFRRILARHRPGPGLCAGAVRGRISDIDGLPLGRLAVSLIDGRRPVDQTTTSVQGEYLFSNVCPGTYTLTAGDRSARVTIEEAATPIVPARLDLDRVRRVLDLSTAPVWELSEALGLPSETVRLIGAKLPELRDVRALAKLAGVDERRRVAWTERNVLSWTKARRPPRRRAPRSRS